MNTIRKIVNKFLKLFQVRRMHATDRVVYLTFDDGPEPGISEFVLDELARYDFRATFFCSGENAEKNPHLMKRIREAGHSVGNHSYSHSFHPYQSRADEYVGDVLRAHHVLHTSLFRPPWGSISAGAFWQLYRRFTFYYWSLSSDDAVSEAETFNPEKKLQMMAANTAPGEIVLFHFCTKHEAVTRLILPLYLKWLHDNAWKCEAIPSAMAAE